MESEGIVAVEPGDEIPVEYGRGKVVIAKALSGRGKRRLVALLQQMDAVKEQPENVVKVFELAEEAFKLCVPDASEELLETLDERQQIQVAGKVLATTHLTEEQRKKLESPR